jgi:hypothetical protein
METGESRRARAIDAAFPYLKDYGRAMSQSMTYELGILVSCMRLGTIASHTQLLERLGTLKAKTQADEDVIGFVVQHGSPMVNPQRS